MRSGQVLNDALEKTILGEIGSPFFRSADGICLRFNRIAITQCDTEMKLELYLDDTVLYRQVERCRAGDTMIFHTGSRSGSMPVAIGGVN